MLLRVLLLAAAFIGVAFAALDLGDLHLDLRRQREGTPQQQQQPDCDSASYQKSSLTLLSSKKFAAMYLRSAHMRQFEASGVSIGPSGQGERREERKKREREFFFFFFDFSIALSLTFLSLSLSLPHLSLSLSFSKKLPSCRRLRQLPRPGPARLPALGERRARRGERRVPERVGGRGVER